MQNEEIVNQLQAASKALVDNIDIISEIRQTIDMIHDPEKTLAKAYAASEEWHQKCLKANEGINNLVAYRSTIERVHSKLTTPLYDLDCIVSAWEETDDDKVLFYLATQMAEKSREIVKIFADDDAEEDDATEQDADVKLAA